MIKMPTMSHSIIATALFRTFAPVRRRLPITPATTLLLSSVPVSQFWMLTDVPA